MNLAKVIEEEVKEDKKKMTTLRVEPRKIVRSSGVVVITSEMSSFKQKDPLPDNERSAGAANNLIEEQDSIQDSSDSSISGDTSNVEENF